MNYILGKQKDNKVFTKDELELLSNIDLFDMNVVNICKMIWENRNNTEILENFLKELEGGKQMGVPVLVIRKKWQWKINKLKKF